LNRFSWLPGSGIKKTLFYCLGFLVLWALYLAKIAPTFLAGDSPETIMAFSCLGIQHPPGYALNTLFGRIFLSIPAGNIMFRSALMAAFFNIITAFVLFFLAMKIFGETGKNYEALCAALTAVIFYLFANPVFLQGVSAKGSVYTLHSLLITFIFLLLFNMGRSVRFLYLASFLFGLSLGNHWQSSAAMLPALALAVYIHGKNTGYKAWAKTLMFFLIGLSVFAYVFIRAAAHPALAWGDAIDLKGLLWLLGRGQYGPSEHARTINNVLTLVKYYFTNVLPEQYPALLAYVLFPGAALLIWKLPKYGPALALGFACYMAGIFFISTGTGFEWVIKQFSIFTSIFTAIFIAYAVYWTAGLLEIQGLKRSMLTIAPAIFFLLFYAGIPDYSRYFLSYDYMNNAAMNIPDGSLYFAEGDQNVFNALYKQVIGKKNMHVVTIALLNHGWYRDQLKKNNGITMPEKGPNPVDDIKNLMTSNKDKGIFYSNTYNKNLLSFSITPMGIINKVLVGGERPQNDPYMYYKAYSYRGIFDDKIEYDDFSRMLVLMPYEKCLVQLGDILDLKGDNESALFFYERAFAFYEEDIIAAKIGSYYLQKGDAAKSGEYLDEALRINPKCVPAYYYKAAVAYMLNKDPEKTRAYLQKVLEYDKNNEDAKGLLKKLDELQQSNTAK
jgi:tetratricopeptide (TPR) repeat protein